MVRNAFAAMDLTSPGSTPFHLVASVQYELAGSAQGVYELWWATPDRWRESFQTQGGESESNLALGNKLYVLRSGPAPSLASLRTREILHPTGPTAFTWTLSVQKVLVTNVNGRKQICVDAKGSVIEERACLDPVSSKLVSVSERTNYLEAHRSDFQCLGEKCFPRDFESRYFDERMRIQVTDLETAGRFTQDVFAVPQGSVERDWCAVPTQKGRGTGTSFNVAIGPPRLVAYWLLVGSNGRLENAVALRSGGSAIDGKLKTFFQSRTFPVKLCGGRPIEYDVLFDLPSHVQ